MMAKAGRQFSIQLYDYNLFSLVAKSQAQPTSCLNSSHNKAMLIYAVMETRVVRCGI